MVQLGLISDIHYDQIHSSQIEEKLYSSIEDLENIGVKHLYVLGDLIVDRNKEEDLRSVEKVCKILDSSDIFDCTYLCGNHDLRNITRDEFLDATNQYSTFGIKNYEDINVCYLDTTWRGETAGNINENQLRLAKDACNKNDDVMFLSHHPLFRFSLAGNKWFQEKPQDAICRNCYDFYDRVDFDRITCCVSGHIHQETTTHGLTNWYSLQAFARRTPLSYDKNRRCDAITGSYTILKYRDGIENLNHYY